MRRRPGSLVVSPVGRNGRMGHMKAVIIIATLTLALAIAPAALATGGIIVTHAGLSQGHLTAAWQGPYPASGPELIHFAEDPFVEVATRPEIGSDGFFFSENVVSNDQISDGSRTWIDSDPLAPPSQAGSYTAYIRVHAWDNWSEWDGYISAWMGAETYSPTTAFNLTAVAQKTVVRKGHYVTRWVHGRKHRIWIKPTYRTVIRWADS
jgi:hypothetical protein